MICNALGSVHCIVVHCLATGFVHGSGPSLSVAQGLESSALLGTYFACG